MDEMKCAARISQEFGMWRIVVDLPDFVCRAIWKDLRAAGGDSRRSFRLGDECLHEHELMWEGPYPKEPAKNEGQFVNIHISNTADWDTAKACILQTVREAMSD